MVLGSENARAMSKYEVIDREKWGEWWKIEGWGVPDTLGLVWAIKMYEKVEMTYWDVLQTKEDAIETDKGGR
jgi:hypothetical protein